MYKEMSNDETLLLLMSDKEALVSVLETSKENVGGKIEDKENEIKKAILEDWRHTYSRIIDEQQKRNRNVVEEIIKQCDDFRDEIGKVIGCVIVVCRERVL
jgi:hypothetical protein